MHFLGSKERLSRRELLKMIWSGRDVIPIIDKEKCTGCGLCTRDCPTGALTIFQGGKEDTYQLLFRYDLCNACSICEKSCPENGLTLKRGLERDRIGKAAITILDDKISRCSGCGIPLFPQAMVNRVRSKVLSIEDTPWPFDLCPSCKSKTEVGREISAKNQDTRPVNG